MSRTLRKVKGKRVARDKSKRKPKDRKDFGYTSGTHSKWDEYKAELKKRAEDPNDPLREHYAQRYAEIKDKSYPEKGVDYIKYGYGKQKKETKVKKVDSLVI
jgi:hypothetical protein